MRVYRHYLGDCVVGSIQPPRLAKLYRKGYPKPLHGAPRLLPAHRTAIRRKLDQWFAGLEIEPKVIGEFEDFALLRVFGQAGAGIVPVPTTLEKQFHNQAKVIRLGIARNVFGRFYAMSAERKRRHPGVVAICETARREVFA